jgi:hypothetical protein
MSPKKPFVHVLWPNQKNQKKESKEGQKNLLSFEG